MRMAVRYCKKYKPGLDVRKINAVFKLVAVGKMSDQSLGSQNTMKNRREQWVQTKARCLVLKCKPWILGGHSEMRIQDPNISIQSKQSWVCG